MLLRSFNRRREENMAPPAPPPAPPPEPPPEPPPAPPPEPPPAPPPEPPPEPPATGVTCHLEHLPPQQIKFMVSFPVSTTCHMVGDKFLVILTPQQNKTPCSGDPSTLQHPLGQQRSTVQQGICATTHWNVAPLEQQEDTARGQGSRDEGTLHTANTRPGLMLLNNLQTPAIDPSPPDEPPRDLEDSLKITQNNNSSKKGNAKNAKILKDNQCYFCKKTWPTPSKLIQHVAVHTGEKIYPCTRCDRSFKTNGDLTRHRRLHNKKSKIRRPFKCPQCDKSFTQKSYVKIHHNNVHLGLRNFPCPECPLQFGEKNVMKRHVDNIHRHIRHKCSQCQKTFAQKGTLQQHLNKEHDHFPMRRVQSH